MTAAARRRARGLLAAALAAGLAAPVSPAWGTSPAATEDRPEAGEVWANPDVRAGEHDPEVRLTITDVSDRGVTEDGVVELRLRVENESSEPFEGVVVTPRHAPAIAAVSDIRAALAADADQFATAGVPIALDEPLGPGESAELTVRVNADDGEPGSLPLGGPGTHPVLVEAAATPAGSGDASPSYTTQRTVVTVRPESDPGEPGEDAGDGTGEKQPAPQLTILYPLAARLPIVPGETGEAPEPAPLLMTDDSLAEELAPGGRLEGLLGGYEQLRDNEDLSRATCLAVDPALLDAVSRMSDGYAIGAAREGFAPTQRRLRDSWLEDDGPEVDSWRESSPAAAEFLSRLSEAAADQCVVALPWANADLDALERVGNEWLLREALSRGPEAVEEAIGVRPRPNIVLPGSGVLSDATARQLGWADEESTEEGTGLSDAFEEQAEGAAREGSSLTLEEPGLGGDTPPGPTPQATVRALVAGNTAERPENAGRFGQPAENVRTVSVNPSLAGLLATLGETPETPAYTDPGLRFDYRLDSPAARRAAGAAGGALAPDEQGGAAEQEPTLLIPPPTWGGAEAATLVAEAADLVAAGAAEPLPLEGYLTPSPEQEEALAEEADNAEPAPAGPGLPAGPGGGESPFPDPAAADDPELVRVRQQANFADDLTRIMRNAEQISLKRYEFTAPLRQDLLNALSLTEARSLPLADEERRRATNRLSENRAMLVSLRDSVSLLPPGNVYTRASESSPLLLVAENGLPLPAVARIAYDPGESAVRLPEDEILHIPARGSITAQLDIVDEEPGGQSTMRVWLTTPQGAQISDSVPLTVQTRAGEASAATAIVAGGGLLAVLVVFQIGRHRRHRREAGEG